MPFTPSVPWPDVMGRKCDSWPPAPSALASPRGLTAAGLGLAAKIDSSLAANPALDGIQAVGNDIVESIKAAGDTFTATLKEELSGGTATNAADLREFIRRQRQKLESEVQTKQDAATDRAIDIIDSLPETLQDTAADAFSDVLDAAADAYTALDGYLRFGLDDVEKLLQNDFEALDRDHRHMADAVAAAFARINYICGNLGGS